MTVFDPRHATVAGEIETAELLRGWKGKMKGSQSSQENLAAHRQRSWLRKCSDMEESPITVMPDESFSLVGSQQQVLPISCWDPQM